MKRPSKRQCAVTLLLLTVSIISFIPKLTWADQQNQAGTATINLSGQAIPFDMANTTDPAPAKLTLSGLVQVLGTGELTMQNLTGALQIGIANYLVTNGQGDANPGGEAIIVADTNSSVDDHQLVMNGGMQGTALNFPAPSSRLTSQFFLALTGGITVLDAQGSSMSAITTLTTSNPNDSYTPFANVTVSQNSTELHSNSTQLLAPLTTNDTLTANLIQPIENGTTIAQYNNQSTNTTRGTSAPTITVTVTQQLYNQTTTVSVTVANSTITQTVTNGAANVTLSQSITTTMTNTTTTNATTTRNSTT